MLLLWKLIVGVDMWCLDIEEFGEEEEVQDEDNEDGVDVVEEFGLMMDFKDEDMLFFFQFFKGLFFFLNLSGKERKFLLVRLEDFGKGGVMGKFLVYESGVVKFKIGDVIFDVLFGIECIFV